MNLILQLLRIKHWIKNLFLFLPAFFGGVLIYEDNIISLLLSFFLFSLMSSSIYIINDIQDIEEDRNHPTKATRPIASSRISISLAKIIFIFLVIISLTGSFILNQSFFYVVLIYFITNIVYSLGAKDYAILDIVLVSLGFLYRVIAGGIIASVVLSKWLFLLTFLLALFIVLAKRRDDILINNREKDIVVRKVSKKYNIEFINFSIIMVSSLMIVCYIMYTILGNDFSKQNNFFVFSSSFFVVIGTLRYYQIIFVENNSGSPISLFYEDKFLQLTLICWVSTFILSIYM